MATFKEDLAYEEALLKIEDIEKERLLKSKISIKHCDLINRPEDYEDIEEDADGNKLGPTSLEEELHVRKNFRCSICGNIPIAPIVQCKDCGILYCGEQCLQKLINQIDEAKAQRENEDKAPSSEGESENTCESDKNKNKQKRNKKLLDHFVCKNKRCPSGANFETVPLGRIIRNFMNTLEFDHKTSGETLLYEKMIKQCEDDIKEQQIYVCMGGCQDVNLKKQDMKEHLVKECPNFMLECKDCYQRFKRSEFYNTDIHNCITELNKQIVGKKEEIVKLKEKSDENVHVVDQLQKEIDKLIAKKEELDQKYRERKEYKDGVQRTNNDLYGSNHNYADSKRIPYIFKKGFCNTLDNIENGKQLDLDEPMIFNFSKKKGEEGFTTEVRIKFKFKRKIPIMAYSFDIQRTKPEEQTDVDNDREEIPEDQRPRNRAYMYIYGFNMNEEKQVQINYQHWSRMPTLQQSPSRCFRWRDCGGIITDRFDLKFLIYNDRDRDQFEKLKLTNLKFYA